MTAYSNAINNLKRKNMFIIHLVISLLFHAEANTMEYHTITDLCKSHKHCQTSGFHFKEYQDNCSLKSDAMMLCAFLDG